MQQVKKLLLAAAAPVLTVLCLGNPAQATIKVLDAGVSGPVGGEYTYTFSVALVADAGVTSTINSGLATVGAGPVGHPGDGDFFALVDFQGYVPGSAVTSGLLTAGGASWSASSIPFGLIPTGYLAPPTPDSAADPNVVFQYIGTGAALEELAITGTTLPLGTITLKSVYPASATPNLYYEAQDFDIPPGADQANQGKVLGPVVPEPSSLLLGGLVVGGLALRRTRRPM